jgi:hypothetical protein
LVLKTFYGCLLSVAPRVSTPILPISASSKGVSRIPNFGSIAGTPSLKATRRMLDIRLSAASDDGKAFDAKAIDQ